MELARVTQPNGHICLAFCCSPEAGDLLDNAMIAAVQLRGTGRPLDPTGITSTSAGQDGSGSWRFPAAGRPPY
jgi:hypothetical protein